MAWVLAALPAVACSDDSNAIDSGVDCFVGDPNLAPVVEVVYRTVDGRTELALDQDQVPLIQPPQGGKVLLAGIRARNLNGCSLTLTALLRDPCNQRIIALEQRPVSLQRDEEGWLVPAKPQFLDDFANIPACPAAGAERDVEGEPYLLQVRVQDRDGRTTAAEVTVTPVCAEPELELQCKCECDGNYILGQACEPELDGGPPPGTCAPDAGLPDATPDASEADTGVPDAGVPDAA
jgi:hypothetical protein